MKALLVDIGNTRIKWRVADLRASLPPISGSAAPPATDGSLSLNEFDRLAHCWRESALPAIDAVFISNVASVKVEAVVERALIAAWGPIAIERIVSRPMQSGVINGYRDPSQLGPDRWMAMIGAHASLPGRSLLICSFGTATTIDLLVTTPDTDTARVAFVGGLILPGIDAMRRALTRDTARLRVRSGERVDFADATEDAITSGILAAQIGAVERAVRDACARLDAASSALACVIAGGAASTVAPLLDRIGIERHVVPDLVLRGLEVVARAAAIGQDAARDASVFIDSCAVARE